MPRFIKTHLKNAIKFVILDLMEQLSVYPRDRKTVLSIKMGLEMIICRQNGIRFRFFIQSLPPFIWRLSRELKSTSRDYQMKPFCTLFINSMKERKIERKGMRERMKRRAVVVAQLAEWSFPTPKVHDSNPAPAKFYKFIHFSTVLDRR